MNIGPRFEESNCNCPFGRNCDCPAGRTCTHDEGQAAVDSNNAVAAAVALVEVDGDGEEEEDDDDDEEEDDDDVGVEPATLSLWVQEPPPQHPWWPGVLQCVCWDPTCQKRSCHLEIQWRSQGP